MKKLLIIGDIHGDMITYNNILRDTRCDMSIQVGDFGIGFGDIYNKSVLLIGDDPKHKFICGNHDNRVMAQTHPNYLGDYGYLSEYDLFFVSGAETPEFDRKFRTPGLNWWPEEELSAQEMHRCVELYQDVKPKIIVSHDGPSCIIGDVLSKVNGVSYDYSRTQIFLNILFGIHKPNIWYFGHWHEWIDIQYEGVEFRCIPPCKGVIHECI